MEIEEMNIGDLIPYEFNSRNHDETQVNRIANSIKEFGFNQPIVIDADNVVIVGHGRLAAARKLGIEIVPVLRREALTEKQIKAYRILDNKLQNDSTWNFGNLELDLGWLEDNGLELEDWGLDSLAELMEQPQEAKEDDYQAPEEITTYIKRGDLIELGRHRVFCGDSTKNESLSELITSKIDLCFTSPPYNAGHNALGGNRNRVDSKYINQSDDKPDDDYLNFLIDFTKLALSNCLVVVVNLQTLAGNKRIMPLYWAHFVNRLIDRAIWYKGHGQPQQAAHVLNSRYEDILFFSGGKEWPNRSLPFAEFHGTESNVHEGNSASSENASSKLHAATFPLHLPNWIFALMPKATTIYDPFLGSGTTLIACEQLGRTCYGIEIEPRYCQVIIDRYYKYCQDNNKPFECKVNGEYFNPEQAEDSNG